MPFKVHIDQPRCKGCGLCVHVCGRKAIRLGKRLNVRGHHVAEPVAEKGCIGCLQCADICPDGAIEIDRITHRPRRPAESEPSRRDASLAHA